MMMVFLEGNVMLEKVLLTQNFKGVCDLNWVSKDWYFTRIVSAIAGLDILQFQRVVWQQFEPAIWRDHDTLSS